MAAQREIERTYAPAPGLEVPDLGELSGVAEVGPARVDELEAVYFDTADLALTRAGVSLRRRTGGPDEGWHLKTPADERRDEVRVPLRRARRQPPAELRRYVLAWARDAPLLPVATVTTRRTRRYLVSDDGTVLAELADDAVTGTPEGSSAPVTWREWELELVEGDPSLLDAADRLLAKAGAPPHPVQRKILQVLGDRLPPRSPAKLGLKRPAGRVVHRRIAEQVAELKLRDSQVRRVSHEGLHKARIACRRLRAALATYRPLLDREVTDPLRTEVKWLGQSLAEARDATVVRDRLRALIDAERPDVVVGPVRARLDTSMRERGRAGWAVAEEALSSERYLALLDALDQLVSVPPWTKKADRPAKDVLRRRVHKDWRRLKRRMAGVAEAEDPGEQLHDVRKDAKRLRYAAEAVEPVWGKHARHLAEGAKGLTSHLGVLQDTAVSRQLLLDIAAEADAAGESSVTWGVLLAREEERAAQLDDELPAAWAKVSRKKQRRWLG